ncbi:hypothetical protein [Pelagibacterium luteolum]|uniref:Uncharacterized protein n=1 Tax=Pelagibacterium luteolum TaxID=440168 RepID=A0A1G7UX94_9HYPH|nr:hypothetical protein [Pelagibacterium luteolum]SDG52116.1 hypothetical protein SAMN04487974_103334 [Pelagibacterium luteolum]
MAKGQKRSNREVKKPKQEKTGKVEASTPADQFKRAIDAGSPRGKK